MTNKYKIGEIRKDNFERKRIMNNALLLDNL